MYQDLGRLKRFAVYGRETGVWICDVFAETAVMAVEVARFHHSYAGNAVASDAYNYSDYKPTYFQYYTENMVRTFNNTARTSSKMSETDGGLAEEPHRLLCEAKVMECIGNGLYRIKSNFLHPFGADNGNRNYLLPVDLETFEQKTVFSKELDSCLKKR